MRYSKSVIGITTALALCLALNACAPVAGNLREGMTPEQAIDAMGQPDGKDVVPDPEVREAELLRYTWNSSGKAATFGRDNRLIKIEQIQAGATQTGSNFDPIATPLDYLFFPVKAGLTWIGSALNCVAENSCHPPQLKGPDS